MNPNDDSQFREFLKEWDVANCPPALESRVMQARQPLWRSWLTGYVRIPAPVAVGLVVLLLAGAWITVGSADVVRCLAAAPAAESCRPELKC